VTIQVDQGPLIVAGNSRSPTWACRLPKGPDFAVDCKRLEVGIKQVCESPVFCQAWRRELRSRYESIWIRSSWSRRS
jgi:hypothetical protein